MLINTYIIWIILHKEFQLSENRGNFKTLLCKWRGQAPPCIMKGGLVPPSAPPGGNTARSEQQREYSPTDGKK
jgi:hypothetical protein